MKTAHVLYHLAKADFLERVRRYSFLITLGLTAYFCYICLPSKNASYVTLQMGGHRGIYDSGYIATLVAMETALIISLVGFYLVNNAVDRDQRSGVGQILAATPLTKSTYTFAKAFSNFAVLAVIVAVMVVVAGVMQLVRREDVTIHVWQLLAPFLIIALPVMTAVASVGVLFEVIPVLRGGLGNVAYFFVWSAAIGLTVANSTDAIPWLRGTDLMLFSVVVPSLLSACEAAFPGCGSTKDFNMGFNFRSDGPWNLTTFHWPGVHWTVETILARFFWIGLAAGAVLLAAVFFQRFDPARESVKKSGVALDLAPELQPNVAARSAATYVSLAPLSSASRRFRFTNLVMAELRLAVKGMSRWWYAVALILFLGGLVSPLAISRFWIIGAWIWPILIWSGMGTREARQGTRQLIFSTAHPLRRQLPACWLAGVIVAAITGAGCALRLLFALDVAGLAAWAVGALFIPTLALALGVWSGSSKLFEVLYTLLWYVGPANRVAEFDYTGSMVSVSLTATPLVFLASTVILGALAVVGRKRQIQM